MIKNLGIQLYTIRDYMKSADDIRAAFTKLKELGYTEAQTAGSGEITYEELGEIAKDCGILIQGTHYDMDTMENDFEKTIRDHKAMGTTNCGNGGCWALNTPEETKAFIKKANAIADKLYEHGMKFTYHNHSHEFKKIDGNTSAWDMLVEGLNPEKTSFVLDTYWVANAGADPIDWMKKLAGRIDILHLKDKGYTTPLHETQNNEIILEITEIGSGNLNWDGIIKTAEETGVKYYCVEQDRNFLSGNPFESLDVSAEFLKKYM